MLQKIALAVALVFAVTRIPSSDPVAGWAGNQAPDMQAAQVYSSHEIPPQATSIPPAPSGYRIGCLAVEYRALDNGGTWGVCSEYGYVPDNQWLIGGYP